MRTYVIALISAILLAVAVTELSSRLWPTDYLALLIVTTIALVINGLFNARLASASAPATASGDSKPASRGRQSAERGGGRKYGQQQATQRQPHDASPPVRSFTVSGARRCSTPAIIGQSAL